jgi:hypothetical protein
MRDKKKKKSKSKPLDMYTYLITRRLHSNSKKQNLSVPGDSMMRLLYDKIVTTTHIRKYYVLNTISEMMPRDFITILRQIEISEASISNGSGGSITLNNKVSLNFKFVFEPHVIDWSSKEMRVRTASWENNIREGDASIERNNLVSEKELTYDKQSNWLKNSWSYWRKACGNGCATPVMSVYLELSCPRGLHNNAREISAIQLVEQKLYAICASKGFEIKAIKGNLWDFSLLFSPVSSGNPRLNAEIPKFPITDEIVAEFTDYVPGKLTDVEIPIGWDIDTNKVVYKNFVGKFGEAESVVIAGITGSGKSVMCKSIVLNVLIAGYTVVVMDRDGEYIPMAEMFGGTVISMSSGSGLYYDSTEIAHLTGDDNTDNGLLNESVVTTIDVFNALVSNGVEQLTNVQRSIINDAYNNMFDDFGIDRKDKSTWKNSSQLSFHLLYSYIVDLKDNPDYYSNYKEPLDNLVDTLRVYFEPDGIYSYLFKNRVSITDIQRKLDGECPIVVLHMDLKDEGDCHTMDKPTLLKLITTNYLSNMILLYNKSKRRFTFDVIEEFQRYLNNTFAKGMAVTKFTGNRKRNAISILVTNNPAELADSLGSDHALKAISDNITTSIIGKINTESSIKPICENLNMANCEDEYHKMIDKPDLYKHVFIARIDGKEAALIKALIPPSLLNTKVFQTRDTKRV